MLKKFIVLLILLVLPVEVVIASSEHSNRSKSCEINYKNRRELEDILKLLLNAALSSRDLSLAEKVVRKGIAINPNNSYWYKWLGKILVWTNRASEALPYLKKAFELSKDRKIAEELFHLAIETNRFDLAKSLLPYVKNVPDNLVISIYGGVGDIGSLLSFLEEKGKQKYLLMAADIRLMIGDWKGALKDINRVLILNSRNMRAYLLKASIYYSMKKFKKSLLILNEGFKHLNLKDKYAVKLLQNLSDLGWMLNDFSSVRKASETLIKLNQSRWEDFYRLIFIYKFCCPQRMVSLGLKFYRKFDSLEVIPTILDYLLQKKNYEEFLKIISKLRENDRKKLLRNDYLFVSYLKVLSKMGKYSLVNKLIEDRLKNSPSPSVITYLIYMKSDLNDFKGLKELVRKYQRYESKIPVPFALAYLKLRNSQMALKLLEGRREKNPLLYAEVLSLSGKKEEAKRLRYFIFKKLEEKLKKNPSLLKKRDFIYDFLYLASYFYPPAKYECLLQEASSFLAEKEYRELYLSYLLNMDEKAKVMFLWNRKRYKLSPWMKLSIALDQFDMYQTKRTIKKYSGLLSVEDLVTAEEEIGRIKDAISRTFNSLENNRFNVKLYHKFVQLVNSYSSYVSISPKILSRSGYREFKVDFVNKNSLVEKGINLWTYVGVSSPINKDKTTLLKSFKTNFLGLKVEKLFSLGSCEFHFLNYIKDRTFTNFGFSLQSHVINELSLSFSGDFNKESSDTVYLYLGGMENKFTTTLSLSRTRYGLDLGLNYKKYKSQSGSTVGYGREASLGFTYTLKSGYPDISIRPFFLLGKYRATGKLGNIGNIMTHVGSPVPEDSTTLGLEGNIGYSRVSSFTRDWKPFLSGSILHNSKYGWGFNISGGVGGELFHGDMLRLELQSSHNAGKVNEHLYQIIINYKRFY
ncbi:MAG: hypothetical protein DSZ26_03115 [Thermovibrio sp.]|nr:MAG: hypothetical protein DSZ26_03115 [Thermovibrio sp.]